MDVKQELIKIAKDLQVYDADNPKTASSEKILRGLKMPGRGMSVSMNASVGGVERFALNLKRKIEALGIEDVDIDVFRSGRGGETGSSYVEIDVNHGDPWEDDFGFSESYRIYANASGVAIKGREISTVILADLSEKMKK